jgi:hypothetical protein
VRWQGAIPWTRSNLSKMTVTEATEKYLNKTCNVYWGPLDRPERKNESIPKDTTNVIVNHIYEDCYGEILFLCDKLTIPFNIKRLIIKE